MFLFFIPRNTCLSIVYLPSAITNLISLPYQTYLPYHHAAIFPPTPSSYNRLVPPLVFKRLVKYPANTHPHPLPPTPPEQLASTSLFGIGSQPTKCVRSYATPTLDMPATTSRVRRVRLVWIDSNTCVLLAADGSEARYRI